MDILLNYIMEQADKKNKTPEAWLADVAKNAAKCTLATHVGRFTNPDVKVIWQVEPDASSTEGYVTTANVHCPTDIATSANYLATAKLLSLTLEDGKTVYEKLLADKESLRQELAPLAIDYDQVAQDLLKVKTFPQPEATDERLRQVYFPIGKEQYHLLTVLSPSSLMLELSRRIRQMETKRKTARDSKNPFYGETYYQLYGLTAIAFGGTKPQNISCLNNEMGGRTYLLASVPPQIQKRELVRPKSDFFTILRMRNFYSLFQHMHKMFLDERNNQYIRKQTRNAADMIIDRVMFYAFALRELEKGWTDTEDNYLPKAQKIWLDDQYLSERLTDDEWQNEIADTFTRWIMQTYERIMRREKVMLGEGEFTALKGRVQQAVKRTVSITSG